MKKFDKDDFIRFLRQDLGKDDEYIFRVKVLIDILADKYGQDNICSDLLMSSMFDVTKH
jgi:hypothetical protein